MKRNTPVLALTLLPVACAGPAPRSELPFLGRAAVGGSGARQEPAPPSRSSTAVTVPAGIGFTDDPDSLLLAGSVDFPVADNWTVGPALQIGVDDDFTLLAPTVQAKRFFPLDPSGGEPNRLLPYVQGGIGVAHFDADRGGDDTGLLIALGGGLRYRLTDQLSLGTQMQFDVLPSEVLDERFYFSWEVVQVVLSF